MKVIKILFVAIICLVMILGTAVAESDCGCDGGAWGDSGGSDSGSGDSSSNSDGSSDNGGNDSGGSSSDSSSSDSGSSSSASSGSAEEGIIWRMKGDDLFKKGLFNESLAAYENATNKDPYAYKSWIGTGRVLLAMNNTDGAATAFAKALRLDPGNTEPYILLGDALTAGGHYEDAITRYEKALAMSPNFAEIKEKITFAKAAAAMMNVSQEITPVTTGIPLSGPPAGITPDISPNTTNRTENSGITPTASFLGLHGILCSIGIGSVVIVLRKR